MKRFLAAFGALAGALLFVHGARAAEMPAVVINEMMWMGSSTSSSDEWIELKNTTDAPVDVTGWSLTKLSSGSAVPMLTIPSGVVPAGGFFVIANFDAAHSRLGVDPQLVDTDVSLVNSKLQVKLYDAAGVLVDAADDGDGNPLAGAYVSGATWKSMERNRFGFDGTLAASWHTARGSQHFDDGSKEWGTPGMENAMQPPTAALTATDSAAVGEAVQFDATDSTGDAPALTFAWDFGDGATSAIATPTHTFAAAGTYDVTVTVGDGTLTATADQELVVTATPAVRETPSATSPSAAPSGASYDTSMHVLLSELLPNPVGDDALGEFIEVVNRDARTVNLNGWTLTDGKHSFRIARSLPLAPGETVAFPRSETKLVLGNTTGGQVFLVGPDRKAVNGVAYGKGKEGQSFARTDAGPWQWTDPTPFERNVFAAAPAPDDGSYKDTLRDAFDVPTAQAAGTVAAAAVTTLPPLPAPTQSAATATVSFTKYLAPLVFVVAIAGLLGWKRWKEGRDGAV